MPRDPRGRPLDTRKRSADRSFRDDEVPSKGGNLFVWTIVILLLIGFALGCWIFSFYVFGHPEKPLSYAILTKLKKLDSPKRFEITAAPRGEFLSAKQLWDRYNKMSDRELFRASEVLQRNYLRNYKLTQDRVPYVVGSFNILDSFELTDGNFFPSGVVAVAESTDAPYVLLEQVFTADKRVVPNLQRMLLTGLNLRLDKNLDLSAVVNVKRVANNRLQFTAVPLLYGNYASSTGPGTFTLDPPERLNTEAGFPVVGDKILDDADKKLASYRMRMGLKASTGAPEPQDTRPQLVRVERPQLADDSITLPSPTPEPTPAQIVKASPTPEPRATPPFVSPTPTPAVAAATPTPTPAADVALQPFLTPSPTPASIATTAGGAWPTYAPGQMPRGRLLSIQATSDLANQGGPAERTYLQGNFVVTASGPTRAIMRASGGGLSDTLGFMGKRATVRVLVDFPAGVKPPGEGSAISRDSRRPFLITRVVKAENGDVNVYVQEVTRPQ